MVKNFPKSAIADADKINLCAATSSRHQIQYLYLYCLQVVFVQMLESNLPACLLLLQQQGLMMGVPAGIPVEVRLADLTGG